MTRFSKKKKILKIILVSGLVVALGGGIFWLGKKLGAKNKVNQIEINQQKVKLEKELQELREQLQNENDPAKKQELEQKAEEIEQQIQNLGNNSQNPPNKTHQQITIKYNTEIGSEHEYIDINDYKKRFLIDTKNKIFSSASNLTIKDKQYNFSFYEEDATEKKGNNFVFDENNDKFQLTPTTTAPLPSKNPSNDPNSVRIEEEEIKIQYLFDNKEYIHFNNFLVPEDGWSNPINIYISKNNPVWGGRNWDQTDWRKTPNFKISFFPKDASKYVDWRGTSAQAQDYYFDENNNNFTLTALGNWPDDNSEPGPIPSPGNQTPPPAEETKSKITLILKCNYLSSLNDNYTFAEDGMTTGHSVFIHKNNPAVANVHLGNEYKISFELESLKASEFLLDPQRSVFIKENDALEVVET